MGDNEVLAHALANRSSVALVGRYAIKRSSTFVNKYGRTDKEGNTMDGGDGDPHHLMAAFPTLWCYGKGGMETRRPISVPYDVHVDMPASAQMTESPINTNTKSGGMRVEGRVTSPPKSTPTKRRSAAMM